MVTLIILRIFSLPKGVFKKQLRISRFGINSVLGLSNINSNTEFFLDSIFATGFRGGGVPFLLINNYVIIANSEIK